MLFLTHNTVDQALPDEPHSFNSIYQLLNYNGKIELAISNGQT